MGDQTNTGYPTAILLSNIGAVETHFLFRSLLLKLSRQKHKTSKRANTVKISRCPLAVTFAQTMFTTQPRVLLLNGVTGQVRLTRATLPPFAPLFL